MKQECTSINKKRVPAIFKKALKYMPRGSVNLDVGGGKFDTATTFLDKEKGIRNLIYDPYNRSREHNRNILNAVNFVRGADNVTCSHVLNVIKEEEVQLEVMQLCYDGLFGYGKAFFTVYEGDKSGAGKSTPQGYQRNEKLDDYLPLIKLVFPKVIKINGMLVALKYDSDAFYAEEVQFRPLNVRKILGECRY